MGTLSDAGYIISTASEQEAQLLEEATAAIPGFTTDLPSELRTNLISESALVSTKFENGISNLMNGIAPAYANDFMFQQFGQSFGLGPNKPATLAQGELVFSGGEGKYIPKNLEVTNEAGTTIVTTTEDAIISSGGEATVAAESTTTESILADTLIVMTDPVPGVIVNNPNAFTAGQPEETNAEYRARVQNTLSAPRIGQTGRAYELLWAIPSVDPRLVFFRDTTVTIGGTGYKGIEAVVGGGYDEDVAKALLNSFLGTKNLVSNPSDSDPARTIEVQVQIYNSTFPVKFTRPKLSTLDITMDMHLENVTTTQQIVSGLLQNAFQEYIDSLHVGEAINENAFNDFVFDQLETINVYPKNIDTITYQFSIDGDPVSLIGGGYLPIEFDQYLKLDSFTLSLS